VNDSQEVATQAVIKELRWKIQRSEDETVFRLKKEHAVRHIGRIERQFRR